MTFTANPVEQATAATDVLLALVSAGCAVCLWRLRQAGPWKSALWTCVFGLIGLAGLLGAASHGLDLSAQTRRLLWMPINLSLGLAVALFVAGALDDAWGQHVARFALPILQAVAVVFFAVAVLLPGRFVIFIGYEAAGILVVLCAYARLAAAGQPGAWLMTAGVLLTAVAAALQQSRLSLTLIWEFDRNGLFHLAQAAALPVLAAGLRASLRGQLLS